jgi:hypothetical protein
MWLGCLEVDELERRQTCDMGNQYIEIPYAQQTAAIFRNGAEAPASIANGYWLAAR